MSNSSEWFPDQDSGAESFEPGDEALDEEERLDPGFLEKLENDPSLDPSLLIDERERMAELIADGILVATPAGSTAYNLSVQGPILPINASLLALTPRFEVAVATDVLEMRARCGTW